MLQWFNGQAVNLVAKGSAVTQQEFLTQHFPGTEAYAASGSPLCLLLLFPVGTIQVFNLLLSRSSTTSICSPLLPTLCCKLCAGIYVVFIDQFLDFFFTYQPVCVYSLLTYSS